MQHQEKMLRARRARAYGSVQTIAQWLLLRRMPLLAPLNDAICGRGWLIQEEQQDLDSWTSWRPHHHRMHISQAKMVKAQIQTCSVLLNRWRDAGFLCLMRSRENSAVESLMIRSCDFRWPKPSLLFYSSFMQMKDTEFTGCYGDKVSNGVSQSWKNSLNLHKMEQIEFCNVCWPIRDVKLFQRAPVRENQETSSRRWTLRCN